MTQINWKRWLPTSAPLLSGAVASGVVLALRKLGIVVLPQEITAAVTPIIGFLTAAVVHKPSGGQVKDLEHAEETTLGSILAREFQGRLDSDPDLIQRVMNAVLPQAAGPASMWNAPDPRDDSPESANTLDAIVKVTKDAVLSHTAAANPGQPRSNFGAIVGPRVDQGVDLTPGPQPLPSEPRKVAIVQPSSAAVIPVVPLPGPPADAVDEHGNLTQAPVSLDQNGNPIPQS